MPITRHFLSNMSRDGVIQYILENKRNKQFRVIDVGGSATGWSSPYIDALVDMNPSQTNNIMHFYGDINKDAVWNSVREYVIKNGKFDFCICTHTLEDIRDPAHVCDQMQSIANEGYIAVPSKHREFSRFEHGSRGYRGYIHHRWIYDICNSKFKAFPKLSFLETMTEFDILASTDENISDLSFYWKDDIPLVLCNDDYMGPSVDHVKQYFNQLL